MRWGCAFVFGPHSGVSSCEALAFVETYIKRSAARASGADFSVHNGTRLLCAVRVLIYSSNFNYTPEMSGNHPGGNRESLIEPPPPYSDEEQKKAEPPPTPLAGRRGSPQLPLVIVRRIAMVIVLWIDEQTEFRLLRRWGLQLECN
jgi:hypothetical protein